MENTNPLPEETLAPQYALRRKAAFALALLTLGPEDGNGCWGVRTFAGIELSYIQSDTNRSSVEVDVERGVSASGIEFDIFVNSGVEILDIGVL